MRGRFREKATPRRYWRSIKGGLESRQSRDGNGFALTLGEPTESGRKRLRADAGITDRVGTETASR